MKLLIATRNRGKIVEIKKILAGGSPPQIKSLLDFPNAPDVIEDGTTFQDNALKKAREIFRWSGQATLADDSGLVVPALDGRPGVHSARYAGVQASDEDNLQKLLQEIQTVPEGKRQAHYVCVMALATPDGQEVVMEGRCDGEIILERRGTGGFGYDPVFYLPDLGKTMAELPLEIKNQRSHRGKALRKINNEIMAHHGLRIELSDPNSWISQPHPSLASS